MKKENQVRIYKRDKVGKTQLYTTSEEPISNFFFKLLIFNERTEEFTLIQEYFNIKRLKKYSFLDNSYAIGIPQNAPKSSMTQAIEALKREVQEKSLKKGKNHDNDIFMARLGDYVQTKNGRLQKLPLFYQHRLNPYRTHYLLLTIIGENVHFVTARQFKQIGTLSQATLFDVQGIENFLKKHPILLQNPLFALGIPEDKQGNISSQLLNKIYPKYESFWKKRHIFEPISTDALGNPSNPYTILPDMLRHARHINLSEQLEIVSPSNYKNIKDFKPFLTNYKGDVLAIPCSTRIKNRDVNFNIFGWYIDDNGFVKLRWFPHHKEAVNKRSSTIFIDIRSKQLFFSGSILDSETQDPAFLESIQFLDERLKQHGQAFQNSFNSFMTSIHHMKKMGRVKSKDSIPASPHRRRRY